MNLYWHHLAVKVYGIFCIVYTNTCNAIRFNNRNYPMKQLIQIDTKEKLLNFNNAIIFHQFY